MQVDAFDDRFLVLTASIETTDLPELKQLADLLARIDAHFAVAAVGGGSPDPSETTLNQALLGRRTETLALRAHVTNVQAAVTGIPIFEPSRVTMTLPLGRPAALACDAGTKKVAWPAAEATFWTSGRCHR